MSSWRKPRKDWNLYLKAFEEKPPPDRLCEHYGYELMIFPALATPKYQIYSGEKIQGGIGDNLASKLQFTSLHID